MHGHPGRVLRAGPVGEYQNADHQAEQGDDVAERVPVVVTGDTAATFGRTCRPLAAVQQVHDGPNSQGAPDCLNGSCDPTPPPPPPALPPACLDLISRPLSTHV